MDGRLDPWELPPIFGMSKKPSSLRTPSGYWKEKEDEFIAILYAEGAYAESSSSGSPSYEGTRRTLQFYLKDGTRGGEGTKTDWMIHEYHLLRKDDAEEALFLQAYLQDVEVLCKVFKKGAAYQYPDIGDGDPTKADRCFEQFKKEFSGENSYLDHNGVFKRLAAQEAIICVLNLQMYHHENNIIQQDYKIVQQNLKIQQQDNIWQHFTKIRTKDEVYAACHHCDKLLKAHPKKHGTSHLERHMNSDKCRSCCSNPSTDDDREMLRLLRAVLDGDPFEQQEMEEKRDCHEDLTQLDPWDLNLTRPTPWYVTKSLKRQTQGGQWKEIRKEFTAIRMEQQQSQGHWKEIAKDIIMFQMDQLQLQVQVPQPQYMGLRRTLQFHHQDGRKMDWIMLEYQQPDAIEPAALFLQGDMVIRKVFHYDKDVVTAIFSDFNNRLNDDDPSQEYYYKGEGVNTEITTSGDYMHGGSDRKRKRSASSKRTSEVWMYFTEIRTVDHDVVYAVCHHCGRVYSSGRSTNGTSHLWRHKKNCTSKLPGIGNVNMHEKRKSSHCSYS